MEEETVMKIIMAVFLVISTLTVMVNVAALLVIARTRSLWTPSHIYVASLAVADLMNGVAFLLFCLAVVPGYMEVVFAHDGVCLMLMFLLAASSMASCLTFTMVAADRYVSVCHPFFYSRVATNRRVLVLAALAWLLALVLGGLVIHFKRVDPVIPACVWDYPMQSEVYVFCLMFYTCVLVSGVAYALVARVALRHLRHMSATRANRLPLTCTSLNLITFPSTSLEAQTLEPSGSIAQGSMGNSTARARQRRLGRENLESIGSEDQSKIRNGRAACCDIYRPKGFSTARINPEPTTVTCISRSSTYPRPKAGMDVEMEGVESEDQRSGTGRGCWDIHRPKGIFTVRIKPEPPITCIGGSSTYPTRHHHSLDLCQQWHVGKEELIVQVKKEKQQQHEQQQNKQQQQKRQNDKQQHPATAYGIEPKTRELDNAGQCPKQPGNPENQHARVSHQQYEQGDNIHKGNTKQDNIQQDNTKQDNIRQDNIRQDNIQQDNIQQDNIQQAGNTKQDNIQQDSDIRKNKIQQGNTKQGNIQQDNIQQDNIKQDNIQQAGNTKQDNKLGNIREDNIELGNIHQQGRKAGREQQQQHTSGQRGDAGVGHQFRRKETVTYPRSVLWVDSISPARETFFQKVRALKMFIVVLGVFCLFWCPYTMLALVHHLHTRVSLRALDMTFALGQLNSLCNVFIYMFFSTDFRVAMKRRLCRCCHT